MIFATVGTQVPFDRMIRAVDEWAAANPSETVVAQIGQARYVPRHCRAVTMLSPRQCLQMLRDADLIVAHAGMGTIITALELGKPVIVMPRRAALGEQRNDHQLATAEKLSELSLVRVAPDAEALNQLLSDSRSLRAAAKIGSAASPRLIRTIQRFLVDVSLNRDPSLQLRKAALDRFQPVGSAVKDA